MEAAKENMAFYIDPQTHDLVLDKSGRLKQIYGDESAAQAIRLTLEVYKGEFPLDITHGTDYERIMGSRFSQLEEDEAAEVIREAIFQETRVTEITGLIIEPKAGGLSVNFKGRLITGNTIETEVNIT